jgi:hypothetical protein
MRCLVSLLLMDANLKEGVDGSWNSSRFILQNHFMFKLFCCFSTRCLLSPLLEYPDYSVLYSTTAKLMTKP